MSVRLTASQTRQRIAQLGIERPVLSAFAFTDPAVRVRYAWHRHTRHQLLVPVAGSVIVETRERLHLCDAGTGVWIPAGCTHATRVGAHAAISVFFSPRTYRSPVAQPTGIDITPLVRELAATGASASHGLSRAELRALHALLFAIVRRGIVSTRRPTLPHPRSRGLRAAVQYAVEHVDGCRVADLARAAGMSDRSLRRRFVEELGLTPEQYVRRVRLLTSMQMLAGAPSRSVLEVALAVGYSSQSAFAAAFKRTFGTAPRRVRRQAPPDPGA
jgi:AraC-like DNA-binding protein